MTADVNHPVDLSIRHFVEAWRTMCVGARGYAEEAAGGVHCVFSGIPIPFLNIAVVTGRDVSAEALRGSGQRTCEWASTRQVPWLFAVTHETLAAGTDPGAALESCGLAPLMQTPE